MPCCLAEMDYGYGGFVVTLPNHNKTEAEQRINALKVDFIDEATRAVAFSWSMYNPYKDLFSVFRVVFEFSSTNYMETVRFLRHHPESYYDFFALFADSRVVDHTIIAV